MKKTFRLKADIRFEAEDMDDARLKLALYFEGQTLYSEVSPYEVKVKGEIILEPEDGTPA